MPKGRPKKIPTDVSSDHMTDITPELRAKLITERESEIKIKPISGIGSPHAEFHVLSEKVNEIIKFINEH